MPAVGPSVADRRPSQRPSTRARHQEYRCSASRPGQVVPLQRSRAVPAMSNRPSSGPRTWSAQPSRWSAAASGRLARARRRRAARGGDREVGVDHDRHLGQQAASSGSARSVATTAASAARRVTRGTRRRSARRARRRPARRTRAPRRCRRTASTAASAAIRRSSAALPGSPRHVADLAGHPRDGRPEQVRLHRVDDPLRLALDQHTGRRRAHAEVALDRRARPSSGSGAVHVGGGAADVDDQHPHAAASGRAAPLPRRPRLRGADPHQSGGTAAPTDGPRPPSDVVGVELRRGRPGRAPARSPRGAAATFVAGHDRASGGARAARARRRGPPRCRRARSGTGRGRARAGRRCAAAVRGRRRPRRRAAAPRPAGCRAASARPAARSGPACTCTTRDPAERATRCAASSVASRSLPDDGEPQPAARRRAGQQLRFRRAGSGRDDRPHGRVHARQDVRDRGGVLREPGERTVRPDENRLRPGRAHVETDRGARVVAVTRREPNGRRLAAPSAAGAPGWRTGGVPGRRRYGREPGHSDRATHDEGVAMLGLMQDRPLALPHVFHRAEQLFGHKPIVTATADGEVGDDRRRVGRARAAAGHGAGLAGRPADGRVGTFCGTPRAPGALPGGPVHRPGAAHAQHPAVPRAAGLHREPRRGRRRLRRPLAAAGVHAAAPQAAHGPALHRDRRRHRLPGPRRRARLRRAARRRPSRSTGTVRGRRREHAPRRCATRPAPPATRRAWSTATGRRCCTR